jgi:hypothetical protein
LVDSQKAVTYDFTGRWGILFMQETEQAAEPERSGDSASRKRASFLKRYALTLASAVFRPRHLRKENYDSSLVFGPVVFSFITLIGFSLLQLALWQRDPLAAAFELPGGLGGAGTTVSDIRSELAFLPWTPVVLIGVVVL